MMTQKPKVIYRYSLTPINSKNLHTIKKKNNYYNNPIMDFETVKYKLFKRQKPHRVTSQFRSQSSVYVHINREGKGKQTTIIDIKSSFSQIASLNLYSLNVCQRYTCIIHTLYKGNQPVHSPFFSALYRVHTYVLSLARTRAYPEAS